MLLLILSIISSLFFVCTPFIQMLKTMIHCKVLRTSINNQYHHKYIVNIAIHFYYCILYMQYQYKFFHNIQYQTHLELEKLIRCASDAI